MQQSQISQILTFCNIKFESIEQPKTGYRNITYPVITKNKKLNLILYKNEPNIVKTIRNANKISNYLANNNYPSRKTYLNKIIKLKSSRATRYVCLYYFIEGETISWESYSMKHLKSLGLYLAKMHKTLEPYKVTGFNNVANEYINLNHQMISYFSNEGVINAIRNKLNIAVKSSNYENLLNFSNNLPSKQILHMDFVRGNILFNDKDVCGVIDFEKVCYGNTLFDVSRTLAFLLIDCKYKEKEKIIKYFLKSGYIKSGEIKLRNYRYLNSDLLSELIKFFVVTDFYKFLLHNPYEFLNKNEHYIRTKDYLIDAGFITKL